MRTKHYTYALAEINGKLVTRYWMSCDHGRREAHPMFTVSFSRNGSNYNNTLEADVTVPETHPLFNIDILAEFVQEQPNLDDDILTTIDEDVSGRYINPWLNKN